jgi:hypothetical protein
MICEYCGAIFNRFNRYTNPLLLSASSGASAAAREWSLPFPERCERQLDSGSAIPLLPTRACGFMATGIAYHPPWPSIGAAIVFIRAATPGR